VLADGDVVGRIYRANAVCFLKLVKCHRDSSLQNSNRVHFLFMTATDREAPIATSVAKKIVRLAKRGERNPARLTEGVISSFRAKPIPM
jgi:hypothetical protein